MSVRLNQVSRQPCGSPRATPVVFVHGAWHGAWCWAEHFLPYFARHGYAAHAFDLRGHGRSDGAGGLRTHRIADYVDDLDCVVRGLDGTPALVGHSMGGVVVQKYLESRAGAGAALLATLPPSGGLHPAVRLARRYPVAMLKVAATRSLRPLIATPQQTRTAFFSAGIAEARLMAYHARLQDESFRAFLDLIALDRPDPKRVRAPVLVLGAHRDTIISRSEVEATAAAYRTSATLLPTAHDMMLDDGWQEVADHILRWLDDLPR
ncbi:lysophospholipase [Actinoplanes sp. NBC_00393]|uniref:alpha/beta hydrolase n=1 Tax=Actinoplanes sp. NBC_00393 TaxID=2975953 RepID=UPI002E1C3399